MSPSGKRLTGTYNLWIDLNEDPDAFTSGTRRRWGKFEIAGEHCCVVSEGASLAGILRGGDERPVKLFDIPFALKGDRRRHLVTIGWKRGRIRIFLDAKLLAEFSLSLPR